MTQQSAIKHEWYQTESHVVVCLLLKNTSKDDLTVTTTEQTLVVQPVDAEKSNLNLNITLAHKISPNETIVKYLSTKIEMKLKKAEGLQWASLEQKAGAVAAPTSKLPESANLPKYPTSSKKPKDWDKIEHDVKTEEKEEKLEGDAALNKLFQDVYQNGNEEVRKAMNKSFLESGGTVLSTNWQDIGKQKVECKPPDGMEFKKWDS